MTEAQIREQIQDKLNELDVQDLIFIHQLLNDVTSYLKQKKTTVNSVNNPQSIEPSKFLKDSDFIGCFADDPDLSEKSEQLAKSFYLSKTNL